MIASPPSRDVEVPAAIRRWAGGRTLIPVWQNMLGGLTFEVLDGPSSTERFFVKWMPMAHAGVLRREAEKLRWASRYLVVPDVQNLDADEVGAWLVTRAVPGTNAVVEPWRSQPMVAARAIGEGLRAFHDRLPVKECPYTWSAEDRRLSRLAEAEEGNRAGLGMALAKVPPIDRLVVCHGDPCAPNTLIGPDGVWSAHVDLGSLGLADRWADLAVATWSTRWNYGPGYEAEVLAGYGIGFDRVRCDYYRLLWGEAPSAVGCVSGRVPLGLDADRTDG